VGSWSIAGRSLSLDRKVNVMGILNVTPDSFSDGGEWLDTSVAIKHALRMAEDGADIIDVGGESTRPGAVAVSEADEIARVRGVIEALSASLDIPISIDTSKAGVAERAIEAGASIVNDVTALRSDPEMLNLIAGTDVGLVLMHMGGEPRTMQENPTYGDVVEDVIGFLLERVGVAESSGIQRDRIVVDPGIGFGKTLEHNLQLLRSLEKIRAEVGCPILLGPSRKSFIGAVLDLEVDERLEGTAAVVALAVASGVGVVRVHDVKEMTRVVRMAEAVVGGAEVERPLWTRSL
jgi:dihydropteroate synthase